MRTETYQTISDYLGHTHYGIAEDVTPEELAALKDGTLAHAAIAPRYLAEIEATGVRLETTPAETQRDLLQWISYEIEVSRWDDELAKEFDGIATALNRVHAYAEHRRAQEVRSRARLTRLMRAALDAKATKSEIALAAGMSRPTLDAWFASGS